MRARKREHELGTIFAVLLFVLAFVFSFSYLSMVIGETETRFSARVSESQIYDGDTIQDVLIRIKKLENQDYPAENLWPGIFIEGDTLYVETDIRIEGVDTPEKRPTKAGRTEESIQKEKALAEVARKSLAKLIQEQGEGQIEIRNPELGKYAGRIVAEVWAGNVNVSAYMIEQGLGYPYDGKTKQNFEDWYQ